MPPRRQPPAESPDPLLLTDDLDNLETVSTPTEIIAERPPQPLPPTKRPRTSSRTIVNSPVSSPCRPTLTPAKPNAPSRTRTPLSKAPLNKPTPARTKATPGKTEEVITLGSSTKTTLPTPSRSRSRATSNAKPLTSGKSTGKAKGKEQEVSIRTPSKRKVDDVFDDSPINSPNITRDAFLANEALKRQREARNFKYKGDAHAPRQTRSGRVVGETKDGDEDAEDEFGAGDEILEAGVEEGDNGELLDDETGVLEDDGRYDPVPPSLEESATPLYTLSEVARQHLTKVLSTLTSHHISDDPAPFEDEDKNDALQGLVKLLQGTVDRGEGNSALVTGPRGVGKTRVYTPTISGDRADETDGRKSYQAVVVRDCQDGSYSGEIVGSCADK
jgi:origin recognition complex subunit 4